MDFHILNHPCIPGIKSILSGWMIILMSSWIRLVRILLSIFASIFIREICLKFSFFVESLCGLGIRVIVASYYELCRVPSVSIFWDSLRKTGIRSSLNLRQNSALNPPGSGLFLVGRLLMTASISLGDMGLFRSLI